MRSYFKLSLWFPCVFPAFPGCHTYSFSPSPTQGTECSLQTMQTNSRPILQSSGLLNTVQRTPIFQCIIARRTEGHQQGACLATTISSVCSQEASAGLLMIPAGTAEANGRGASGQAESMTGSGARCTLQRNRHFRRMMRTNLASEGAAAEMLKRRSKWAGLRPDLEYYKVPAKCRTWTQTVVKRANRRMTSCI